MRTQDHRYRLTAIRRPKSNGQASLRGATYDESFRLESCSRDPIGYEDGLSLYVFLKSSPVTNTDPTGHSIAPEPVYGFVPYLCFNCYGIAFGSCSCQWRTSQPLANLKLELVLLKCSDGPGISCCDKSIFGGHEFQVQIMNSCFKACMERELPDARCSCI